MSPFSIPRRRFGLVSADSKQEIVSWQGGNTQVFPGNSSKCQALPPFATKPVFVSTPAPPSPCASGAPCHLSRGTPPDGRNGRRRRPNPCHLIGTNRYLSRARTPEGIQ